ncbi:Protein of unknown function DUF4154 [Desulfococcus multivorans DSM 2059]|uniref:Transmembrane protein n=1 Tax=Desulfococcus multivorans DSM 2059 TaxID=1121405 RepID=S7V5Y2_DESML|nr:Protein of unknown function DUF4154 [Desulfococcus multivorans DSM 2059]SKA01206.1 protein of unknown function [Desulfococcus multivorans DSM 2059]
MLLRGTRLISTGHRRAGLKIWAILFCLTAWLPGVVSGETLSGAEYKVKLGFVYHFIRFTQWPPETFPSSDSPINLCIASTNPAADMLFSLQDRVVKGRRIDVRKIAADESLDACQILFIASDDETFVAPTLGMVRKPGILSIGEIKGFTRMGGVINFFVNRNQLRFEVNLDAAESAGLKFSSQLLMSADIVQKREE